MSQGTDLICDHCKSAPGFSRSGGFDGRVQGQQIRLLRNSSYHVEYLPNIASPLSESFDKRRSRLHIDRHRLDGLNRLHHLVLPLLGNLVGGGRGLRSRHRVTSDFLDSDRHFIDCGSSLLKFVVLPLQSFGRLLGNGTQLFGG
ncbi:hypothetical protein D3C85_1227200 [compost metagenome]